MTDDNQESQNSSDEPAEEMIPKGVLLSRLKEKEGRHLDEKQQLLDQINQLKSESAGMNDDRENQQQMPNEDQLRDIARNMATEMREQDKKDEQDRVQQDSYNKQMKKNEGDVNDVHKAIHSGVEHDSDFTDLLKASPEFGQKESDELVSHLTLHKDHVVPIISKLLSDDEKKKSFLSNQDPSDRQRLINQISREVAVEQSSRSDKTYKPMIKSNGPTSGSKSIHEMDEDEYADHMRSKGLYDR